MPQGIVSLTLCAAVALGTVAFAAQAPPDRPVVPAALPARPAAPVARPKPTPAPPPFFEGIVLGPDAKPVADAVIVVSAAPELNDLPIVTRTGANGAFRIQARRRGAHTVRIEARGLAAQTIEKALPGAPLRVTLARGGTIEGTVRDASSGAPVAGARVEAREEGTPIASSWEPGIDIVATQTDTKGAFKLEGLARGRHTVTASSRASGRASQSGIALGGRVDLLLVAGPSISGRVLTPDGMPAAGAAVRAELEFGPGQTRLAGADAAGRFEITLLSPGPYRVIAQHKDWAFGMVGGVRADRSADVEVDVVLAPPVRVTGRLVDTEERPLPGTVSLQEFDGQAAPRALGTLVRAEAGADGRFVLERMPPGSHALAVVGRGVASRRVAIDVGARQKTVDVGDVVLEAGAQIRGRVRDKAGAPIADAALRGFADGPGRGVPPIEGRTEADGTFVLGGATAPGYRLLVQAPGFAPSIRPVEAPSDGVEIVLDAAGSIAGVVVDEAGRPVDTFEVTAQPSGGQEMFRPSPRGPAVVSEGGRFTLDDVAPGTYAVEVSARDLGRQVVSNVRVAAGAVRDVGRIRLAPGGAVRGAVLDGSGSAIAGAIVEARGPDRAMVVMSDLQETVTDAGGGFHLRGLPTGTAVVIARHPDFAEGRSEPMEIEPSRTAETSIVLTRGGRIEGVVRRRGGGAAPDAVIHVRTLSSPASFSSPPAIMPRADGTFGIDHVAPGRVGVSLMTRTGSGGSLSAAFFKEVDVREDETARVEFVWREILLTGKVTRGGVALPNVRLTARGAAVGFFVGGSTGGIPAPPSGPQRMTAVTREDGSYEMIVGDPGRTVIRAEAVVGRKSYPVRTIEITDVEAQTADLDFPVDSISGIVVDEETDAPIARATLMALPARRGPGGGQATTGPDGRFNMDLDAGTFRLRAAAEGYAEESIEVKVGESPVGEVRIALSRGARIRGKVVDSRGRPVAGTLVTAREEADDDDMGPSVDSTVDGAFEFSALRPGSYSLAGGSALSGFGTLTGISPGAPDVLLRLTPGGRIRVSVKAADGSPVGGAFVIVRRVNGQRFSFIGVGGATTADGTAEFDSPAGTIEIEARKAKASARGQTQLSPGGIATLQMTLTEAAPPPAP